MVTRPQAQPSQPAAQNNGYHSLSAGIRAGHIGQEGMLADRRAAELAAAAQQGSASPQQAGGNASMPINLPPSMVRIAAALPPVQQQAMVRPKISAYHRQHALKYGLHHACVVLHGSSFPWFADIGSWPP